MSDSTRRNLITVGVIAAIILGLFSVSILRDYTISLEGFTPVLEARIRVPRGGSVSVNNSEPKKLTLTTSSASSTVAGYEFRISSFENMWFAHSYRSVEPKKEIGKLKPGKRYFVQVRCYAKNNMGRIVFGRYGSIGSATVMRED